MRKSTRSFALLLCIALFVCLFGTAITFADGGHKPDPKPDEPWDWAAAEKVYNDKTSFDHVDIRVKGTITYKTYVNNVETSSETKTVTISNPVITITRQGGTKLTKSFTGTTFYEFRWDDRGLQVYKDDTISLTCDITIDGVTQREQHFSWSGDKDFIQAIYICDGRTGLDFEVNEEDIKETFFYQVDYKWNNAPSSSSAPLPTDGNHYAPNANVNVDTTYKAGDTVTENGYVYTFSGWTDYTPKGGSAVQLNGAKSFTITADTTVHGAWSKAPVPTPEYTVVYEWDNAPSSATLPTDSNSYKSGDTVNVDTTYDAGKPVIENGYVYTFSGWTEYTPEGGSTIQLNGATSFAITADTTVYGAWSKAPVPTPEYNVVYEWDNAPSSVTLPTDGNHYAPNANVNVDTTYKTGDTVTEDGYVYSFSGWTDYTPKGGSAVQLNGATSFAITADTTVHGAWSMASVSTPTPEATPTPEETPTPEVTPTPVPTYRPDPTPLPTPEPVDPPQTGDNNTVLQWVAVLLVASTVLAGAVLIKRKYSK